MCSYLYINLVDKWRLQCRTNDTKIIISSFANVQISTVNVCIFEVMLNKIPLNSHIVCPMNKAPHFINDMNEARKKMEITIVNDHTHKTLTVCVPDQKLPSNPKAKYRFAMHAKELCDIRMFMKMAWNSINILQSLIAFDWATIGFFPFNSQV